MHAAVRGGRPLALWQATRILVVAATSVGIAACGSSGGTPDGASHSRASAAAVVRDGAGLFLKVPDVAGLVAGSLPPDVAKGRYWRDPFNDRAGKQFFSWKVFDLRHNRNLTVEVTRKASVAQAREKAAYVRTVLADDDVREGRQTIRTSKAAEVTGIADECLGFRISRKNAMSALPDDPGQKYAMSGRYLYCRLGNVNIVIGWEGLDYSQPGTVDAGTGLGDVAADRDTRRIAHSIGAALRSSR